MSRYQVMLSHDLDEAYKEVAGNLDMSIEQVLSSAVQLYMEHLRFETYESITNVDSVRGYIERHQKVSV